MAKTLPGRHAICGYVVHAEYPLQGLPACAAEEGPLGRIDLRAGPVAEHLDGGTLFGSLVEVTPEAILIKPFLEERELGRILIRAGREIVVAAVPGAELELEPFILGSGMGAISLQQGLLPLHASAVATETGAIAFSGPTGAGKSTLAMTLTARGHTLLTDDLMLVGNADGAVPLAYPGTPTVRLTVESATALGLGPTGTAVQGGKQRHRLPVGAEPEAPRPLEAIYLLEEGPAIRIEPISPIRAFPAITAEAYRHGWYAPMGLFEARMKDIASLTRRIGCFRLVRPHRFEVMGEVADAVLAHRAELSLPKG